jgi:flagellar basal-body rod protein FlgB
MNLDKVFGIHAQAAQLRSYRGEVLAQNIANAETPGYKARDIDFGSTLQKINEAYTGDNEARSSNGNAFPEKAQLKNELLYRIPMQPALDGNTVDMDIEKSEFSKNAVGYQISMSFLNGTIKGILTALKGE